MLFFFAFNILTTILSLPISYYSTFVLEEKFGFNKQTIGLWITDMLKGQALGIALGGPIMAAVLKILHDLPDSYLTHVQQTLAPGDWPHQDWR